MKKTRKPAVAGTFYEGEKNKLIKSIKNCFLDKRGPGVISEIKRGNKIIRGLIVPHAGYIYSGAIAAHSFNILADNGFANCFIIIGPNHTGFGSGVSIMMAGTWVTPLGEVLINEFLAKKLWKGIIDKDDNAHYYEHSIEVQLPFLQFIAKNKFFNFIPICLSMNDYVTIKEVGEIIADTLKDLNENIVIIASTDFSHIGFNYMTTPPKGIRVDKYAEKQDKLAIDQILNLNPKGLIKTVENNNISMCGYGPVAVMLTASKLLGAKKAELLKYGTSYEVHPNSSCVGYGAFAIY